jgi:peptidoglycan hydrolase-like protein with peptidoglycan-binding domain
LDPEPIYYPGRYAYVQRGHPFPKEVKKLQSRLNAVGFTPPLKVDGDYGPRTEEGVKWFQGKVLIEQSGSASELTLVLLWDKKVVKDG